MANTNAALAFDLETPIGQKAEGRGPVDLLLEAERLKFSNSERAELRRLYAFDLQHDHGKTPQKAG